MAKNKKLATASVQEKTMQARQRILAAFSLRARRDGIRAVMMEDITTQLKISMVTLYKHFASKDDLVAATVDAWAHELAALDALAQQMKDRQSALNALFEWSHAWTSTMSKVNPAFFDDLRRDHPASWRRLRAIIAERKLAYMPNLIPMLPAGLNSIAALRLLDRMVMAAVDPRFLKETGLSSRESVRIALAIWGNGAFASHTEAAKEIPETLSRSRTQSTQPQRRKTLASQTPTSRRLPTTRARKDSP